MCRDPTPRRSPTRLPPELGSSPENAAGRWGQDRTWERPQGLESKVTVGMLAVAAGRAVA